MITPMWVRCGYPMEAKAVGQRFQTTKACPEGHRAGVEPITLLELCMKCPKATDRVGLPSRRTPPPKKLVKTPPPMRKR